MTHSPQPVTAARLPALALAPGGAVRVDGDGVLETLTPDAARKVLERESHLLIHAAFVLRRLKADRSRHLHFDLSELAAFVLPARVFIPAATGIARLLNMTPPASREDEPVFLIEAAQNLLDRLSPKSSDAPRAARIAAAMGRAGWRWAPFVLSRLSQPAVQPGGFDVWEMLPEIEEQPPRGNPATINLSAGDVRQHLFSALGEGREQRPQQADYAATAMRIFTPQASASDSTIVLAEAGTGIGKTLGYAAPATLYAERADATVTISTYTRNLQRQIDQELSRIWPDPDEKREKVVIRKGRENYLCLLTYQEAQARVALAPGQDSVMLGLVARWIAATRDGDLLGGDFPSFLLAQSPFIRGLTDRRGECIHSACQHYRRCFVERGADRATRARVVIANHALVMVRAALAAQSLDDESKAETQGMGHFIFDEGHHLFDAADSAFALHLTGIEGAELRRWIRGREGDGASRMRGLSERVDDLVRDDEKLAQYVSAILDAAAALPGSGWSQRVAGVPRGSFERFLSALRAQVFLRSPDSDSDYDIECEPRPLAEGVAEAATALAKSLRALQAPMLALERGLAAKLEEEIEELSTSEKSRLTAVQRGIARRARIILPGWISMLSGLAREGQENDSAFVDWFGVSRSEGRETDMGYFRHHLDPTKPFAAEVLTRTQGALITSATLRDKLPEAEIADASAELDWRAAEIRTGAVHLPIAAERQSFASPFNYPAATRVLVINDVPAGNLDARAAAYAALIRASGGGALGLFTAIRTLRAIHKRLLPLLEVDDLTLYAQHEDAIDTGTLVDLFRAEEDSSLLGTDALRDGVDVPGRSLRMVVFDRVPWPRPDICYKARRKAFGGRTYDEMMTRLRLRQAYGRLIRAAGDKGVFCILEPRTPTRLLAGLPDGVLPARVGLAEAVKLVRDFLKPSSD